MGSHAAPVESESSSEKTARTSRARLPRRWAVVIVVLVVALAGVSGAWAGAHLWMSADELRLHPRDAEHTPTWLAQGAERARTTPPPHPDENEGVHQVITEQERDARRNS